MGPSMEWWIYFMDAHARAYRGERMNVRYQVVKKFDDSLHDQLNVLDLECFPDSQSYRPDFTTGTLIVAYSESKTMLGYGHIDEDNFIDRIGVASGYQRQGLGKHILSSLIAAAKRRRSYHYVTTYVERHNAASILLFLRAGFYITGRTTGTRWWYFERFVGNQSRRRKTK